MRQIWITVPSGKGPQILNQTEQFSGNQVVFLQAQDRERELDVIILQVANSKISEVIEELDNLQDVTYILHPQDVYPLTPHEKGISNQVTSVSPRSPVEVWLNGLQSIGSWKGFLGYALGASIIAWVGMFTNTIYLLVAAMLIAPYAGPAMNLAIATATGDTRLLWRNLLRYFSSLALTIVVSALLSLILQQTVATRTMIDVSELSSYALLLPLVAGAVGALNLTQASNNSLVPGTAVGTLVAASLAPPAALVGMSAALGRWDMALNSVFVLLLQLFAINLSGALVFRAYHLKPGGTYFERGKGVLFYLSLGISGVLLAGLLTWQFWSSPNFQRSTRAQRANGVIQQYIMEYAQAELVEVNMRFPRPTMQHQDYLLGEVYVQQKAESNLSTDQIQQELTQQIEQKLMQEGFQVTPLISVTVFEQSKNP